MKIQIKLLALFLSLILILPGCEEKTVNTDDEFIEQMPENTGLEFWIGDTLSDDDIAYHTVFQFGNSWFYGYEYFIPNEIIEEGNSSGYNISEYFHDNYVKYYFHNSEKYIYEIHIFDPKVNVFGITVNSRLDEFISAFETRGYSVGACGGTPQTETDFSYLATKGDTYVYFQHWNGKESIIVRIGY